MFIHCLIIIDALGASLSAARVKPLQSTLKKDEVKDALLTLVLVLVLQGDFQQSKDYIQKLTESCAQASTTEFSFSSGSPRNTGDAILLQTASEFSSLLTDFVVCCCFISCDHYHPLYSLLVFHRLHVKHQMSLG